MMRLMRSLRPFSNVKAVNWSSAYTSSTYYETLGVTPTASPDQIKQAYTKLVLLYHPGMVNKGDTQKFQKINQAYVILSNDQTKRAYDLLQKEGKQKTHINVTETQVKHQPEKSEYAMEKEQKNIDDRKRLNLDDFGRYRGGLPKYKGWTKRGGALGSPGQFHDKLSAESEDAPDYQYVDAQKAESFRDFHQDERQYRTAKWTWLKAEIDYDYFSFRRLSKPFVYLRNLLLLFVLIPYLFKQAFTGYMLTKQNSTLNNQIEIREKSSQAPLVARFT